MGRASIGETACRKEEMAILKGFPPSNTISTGGWGREPETIVEVTVVMPEKAEYHSVIPEHEPSVGMFYIRNGKMYLNSKD